MDWLINVIEIADKQFGSLAVYHISFTEIQIKHWIFKKSNHSSKQTWVFTVLKCGKPFTVRQKKPQAIKRNSNKHVHIKILNFFIEEIPQTRPKNNNNKWKRENIYNTCQIRS